MLKMYKATYIVKREDMVDLIDEIIDSKYDSNGGIDRFNDEYYTIVVNRDYGQKTVDTVKSLFNVAKATVDDRSYIGVAR